MAEAPGQQGGSADRPALFFRDADEFWAWLERFHDRETELWMGLRKKHVADRGLTWEDAVPIALCWGWIDSQVQRIDEDSVRQRWTPRKPTSNWSRINLALVEKLAAEGRMQPSGMAAYESRRDRPAGYSFEQPHDIALPEPYVELMAANPAATAFWEIATASYRRICITWVTTARQQVTNDQRMAHLIEDHAAGRMIPSQRYGAAPRWVERAAAAAQAAARNQ